MTRSLTGDSFSLVLDPHGTSTAKERDQPASKEHRRKNEGLLIFSVPVASQLLAGFALSLSSLSLYSSSAHLLLLFGINRFALRT